MWPLAKRSTYGSAALHAAGERLVGRVALERVQPDDAVGEPREPRHLLGEEFRVADLQAVRADDDDGAAGEAAVAVAVEERLQRLADPRAAVPVEHLGRGAAQRLVRVGAGERARQRGSAACRSRTPPSAGRREAAAWAKTSSARE